MVRFFALFLGLIALTACTNVNDLDDLPTDMGRFALGHNVVVAPNMVKGPASREASEDEWIESLTAAIDERFGRYEGDKLYHLGVSIEGYVLAVGGIPIVASPKSALIINVTVWDDALGKKLNEKAEQLTVLESFSGETILGSGVTQSREQQMRALSRNAAKVIQNWMLRHPEWFEIGTTPDAAEPEVEAATDE